MSTKLTQARLKELLHYDPETGVFTWAAKAGSARPGRPASGFTNKYGYKLIRIGRQGYAQHRLAWLYMVGEWPEAQVDHVNGQRSDNRWQNLREATDAQNRQNMAKKTGTKSTLQGVTWYPRDRCWMSRITVNYRAHFLGYYQTEAEAHQAYLAAKAKLHTFQPTPRNS